MFCTTRRGSSFKPEKTFAIVYNEVVLGVISLAPNVNLRNVDTSAGKVLDLLYLRYWLRSLRAAGD